jgi:hypothetical protein
MVYLWHVIGSRLCVVSVDDCAAPVPGRRTLRCDGEKNVAHAFELLRNTCAETRSRLHPLISDLSKSMANLNSFNSVIQFR